jgi:hypothetical protein
MVFPELALQLKLGSLTLLFCSLVNGFVIDALD